MSYSEKTDEQLMKSISKGSEEAFEQLYFRYKGKLMSYIVFKLKNREIAQELFQITWAKVLQHSHKFDLQKSFSPWLMTIANNNLKDWFKKNSNYSRLLESYKDVSQSKEVKHEVLDLTFLKKEAQDVLNMKYVEGLSSKEIAQKLNLTDSNVRKISSRAIKEIRSHILMEEKSHE